MPWKETGGNKSWAGLNFSQKSQPLDILLNDGVISPPTPANSCQLTWISAPFSLVTIYSPVNPTSPTTAKKKKAKRTMSKHLVEGSIKV